MNILTAARAHHIRYHAMAAHVEELRRQLAEASRELSNLQQEMDAARELLSPYSDPPPSLCASLDWPRPTSDLVPDDEDRALEELERELDQILAEPTSATSPTPQILLAALDITPAPELPPSPPQLPPEPPKRAPKAPEPPPELPPSFAKKEHWARPWVEKFLAAMTGTPTPAAEIVAKVEGLKMASASPVFTIIRDENLSHWRYAHGRYEYWTDTPTPTSVSSEPSEPSVSSVSSEPEATEPSVEPLAAEEPAALPPKSKEAAEAVILDELAKAPRGLPALVEALAMPKDDVIHLVNNLMLAKRISRRDGRYHAGVVSSVVPITRLGNMSREVKVGEALALVDGYEIVSPPEHAGKKYPTLGACALEIVGVRVLEVCAR